MCSSEKFLETSEKKKDYKKGIGKMFDGNFQNVQ